MEIWGVRGVETAAGVNGATVVVVQIVYGVVLIHEVPMA